ncbi:MAG: outer membrane beta-barrel protein [Phycisphaerae bacterium]|nr:outer membrane beta-barrel protein [Phycisphaerae bacterium]
MRRSFVLCLVVCLAFAGGANGAVSKGDVELDFLGGFTTQNAASDGVGFDAWFVSGSLGYFFSENVQASVGAFGMWTETQASSIPYDYEGYESGLYGSADIDMDISIYGIGVKGKYHFVPTNPWVPYVGVQVFWATADVQATISGTIGEGDTADTFAEMDLLDEKVDGMLWGPVAGLRYELTKNNDFFAEYQYHVWAGDLNDILDDGHALFLGLVHQFQ